MNRLLSLRLREVSRAQRRIQLAIEIQKEEALRQLAEARGGYNQPPSVTFLQNSWGKTWASAEIPNLDLGPGRP